MCPRYCEYLPLRYQDPTQSVEAHGWPEPRIVQGALQVKHGDAGAEELGDVVQQQQPVPQGHHRGVLQVVVLHGDLKRGRTQVLGPRAQAGQCPTWALKSFSKHRQVRTPALAE